MAGGHKNRAHALLSPSSAKRWMTCTPSAKLEDLFPNTTSEAAEEGTLCHELCEGKLLNKVSPDFFSNRKLSALRTKLKKNSLWKDEMERTSDVYVEKIWSDALGYKQMPLILAERQLDLTKWIPDGFGTGDCIMVGDDLLGIYDYKHGKGVPVDAHENHQMKVYALGALETFGMLADVKRVKMCIIQPRLNSITEFEMTVEDLRAWGEEQLKPAAEKATRGEGEFITGDHCRFCRAKDACRARGEECLSLYPPSGLMPPQITPEEAGMYLKAAEKVDAWLKDLKKWALSQCLAGHDIPGWKAVEGRSNGRTFTDQEAAFKVLMEHDVDRSKLYKEVPVTLTVAEEIVGAKVFAELCGPYITKPAGAPTLVEVSDKRRAITLETSAEEAFGNSNNDGGNE